MTDKTSGGPAFPVHPEMAERLGCENSLSDVGMSLRDYFAAKAMPSVITDWLNTGDIAQDAEIAEVIARDCYIVADAMLKARHGNP